VTQRNIIIALLGPTASGKSAFAIEMARALNGEIVCVDSTTVYRGFDIGTSKPTAEQQSQVKHHLLDLLSPEDEFNASDFVATAKRTIEEIASRGKTPLLVGGSYFYLRALQNGMYPTGGYDDSALEAITEEFTTEEGLDGAKLHSALQSLDPRASEILHPNDHYRLIRAVALARSGVLPSQLQAAGGLGSQWLWVKYAMMVSRKDISENIAVRTKEMLDRGLVEETRQLREKYPRAKALGSIGYAETLRYLENLISLETLEKEITDNTRKLLKRQITWLRSDPELRFVDSRDLPRVELEIANLRSVLEGAPCNP
jgi:tRNA dimethylallyltransferase